MQLRHDSLQRQDAVAAVPQSIRAGQTANDQALLPTPVTPARNLRLAVKELKAALSCLVTPVKYVRLAVQTSDP